MKNKKCIFFVVLLSLSSFGFAENGERQCLDFRLIDDGKEFDVIMDLMKVPKKHRKNNMVYMAQHDLNGDKDYEMLTYVESMSFCGRQTGCYIRGYKKFEGGYVKLFYKNIPTFNKFKENTDKFVCVLSEKSNNWSNVMINDVDYKMTEGFYEVKD